MIQPAIPEDLFGIKELTEACAIGMQENGIFQWNEQYPSLEKLERDILLKELYVLKENNRIWGIIVLTPEMDEEYSRIAWLSPNRDNLYIHRLAVHPSMWGRGYGRKLMDFAEKFAKREDYVSVRLDTFSQNLRNQKFYETRGYERLGNIYFPMQSEHPFFCYEKLMD